MARYFYLLMAFEHSEQAETAKTLFQSLTVGSHFGQPRSCKIGESWQSTQGLTWLSVEPEGVSLGVGRSNAPLLECQCPEQLTQIALDLYEVVKQVPHFVLALIGWEVTDYFTPDNGAIDQLKLNPTQFLQGNWAGLLINEKLWYELNCPVTFQPFCPNYVWQPWQEKGINGW